MLTERAACICGGLMVCGESAMGYPNASGTPEMFLNINRAEDLQHAEQLTRIPASTALEPSYH
jgi:hypothetical protein